MRDVLETCMKGNDNLSRRIGDYQPERNVKLKCYFAEIRR